MNTREIKEATEELEGAARLVLQAVGRHGDNPARAGLVETPVRFARSFMHYFSGYGKEPKDVLKTFIDGAGNVDQAVVQRDIPVWSLCEHHMAPFFGVVHIGYIPNGKIVGLSKLARLVDIFARRLQVQERLTNQIADALWEVLEPDGVGVVLKCRHSCMEMRGVEKAGTMTVTCALRGAMKSEPEARAEFLELTR